jgi:hypothetical protein
MSEHAEPGVLVWWPANSDWAWRVDHIIVANGGQRYLAISRGETEADIVTRVVAEADVTSNSFQRTIM